MNKYIPHALGVQIQIDEGTKHFIAHSEFDYNSILGLDKPKNRVKARTAPTSPKNCRLGKIRFYINEREHWSSDHKMALAAIKAFAEKAFPYHNYYLGIPPPIAKK